jgi:hypothetical protein
MTKNKKAAAPAAAVASGRSSPEAIQKRRVARRLNDLLSGRAVTSSDDRDGRTEKRRQRLLSELAEGTKKGAKESLKPIEILQRVNELLEIGEPMASIRKVARVRGAAALRSENAVEVLREVHAAYGFRPETYRFLGLPHEVLVAAKLADPNAPRRGRPPKAGRPALAVS